MVRARARTLVLFVLAAGGLAAQSVQTPVQTPAVNIPYAAAKPILEALRDRLPAALQSVPATELEALWPQWVVRRDADIRARLIQGDEDSLVNFLLFGTSFTSQPRALNDSAKLGGRDRAAEILRGRIDDMVAGIASPGGNERLQFARQLVGDRGIDPATPAGKAAVRRYIVEAMRRVVGEVDSYIRALESARSRSDPNVEFAERSRLFRSRGLSSDTSILPDFAVEQALSALAAEGLLQVGRVRQVALIGPGLDFTDKAEGYDFYPTQSIQPFSVIDSLLRLGLTTAPPLRLTTLDVSPRINQHLEAARQRAGAGQPYVVQLPRDVDAGWRPALASYWRQFGDRIGEDTAPVKTPAGLGNLQVRAVRVRPSIVTAIRSENLNIVLQRLEPSRDDEPFDLVVATNVFVYYDAFEQALALANVAHMVRPGGILLTNNVVGEIPAMPMKRVGDTTVVYSDRPDDRDHIVWYRKQ